MAKISFNKLGLKINQATKTVQYKEDFAIEIKQYLPVNDKLKMMGEILEHTMDQNNFANPVKQKVFTTISVIEYYTNITFTDKQKEEPTKLYDAINSSDLFEVISSNIPEAELKELQEGINGIIVAYYQYTNSILGVLESMKQNYDSSALDISKLLAELNNPEAFETLKQIAPAMIGLNT
jgi:hypothetical protein